MDVEKLANIFPLEPPDWREVALTDSSGHDVDDDIKCLIGRQWNEMELLDLRIHFEVFLWLSPEAFQYYIPALIWLSEQEVETYGYVNDTALAVDYALSFLSEVGSEDTLIWRAQRWAKFSNSGLDCIIAWITRFEALPSFLTLEPPQLISALTKIRNDREKGVGKKS